MLKILKRDFPEKYNGLAGQDARVSGWVTAINDGSRGDDDIRDDIAKHIIGTDLLMKKYGVNKDTANKLILGGNEGGLNFSDLKPGGKEGTNQGGGDVKPLRILRSNSLTWFKDTKTGKYYARYQIPGTNHFTLFEAEDEQVKALFDNGVPPSAQSINVDSLIRREDYHFSGNVAEVEGDGQWETEVNRVITLALDQRSLPDWIKNDSAAQGFLWMMVTEDRSDDWFYDQISKLPSFKKRYPGLDKLTGLGLTTVEAVQSFTEFEVQAKQLHAAAGFDAKAITPDIVGGLLTRGYNIKSVAESYSIWKRMNDNAPALAAFNQVLQAQGKAALSGTQMYKFLQGTAEGDLYDIYEASAIREAATGVGLGNIFSANDALSLALGTTQNLSVDQAYQQFSQVAAQALRFRHELDVSKFGLDVDDLIDVSFGRAPRSGKTVADVGETLTRISKAAEAALGPRINPFTGFTTEGRPQARSLAALRQAS